jgi:hypothetical protein
MRYVSEEKSKKIEDEARKSFPVVAHVLDTFVWDYGEVEKQQAGSYWNPAEGLVHISVVAGYINLEALRQNLPRAAQIKVLGIYSLVTSIVIEVVVDQYIRQTGIS